VTIFSLFLQLGSGIFYARPVFSEDVVEPTPTEQVASTPGPTTEPTSEPTTEPTSTPTPTPTPTPTSTPTLEASPTVEPSPTPEATPEISPTPSPTPTPTSNEEPASTPSSEEETIPTEDSTPPQETGPPQEENPSPTPEVTIEESEQGQLATVVLENVAANSLELDLATEDIEQSASLVTDKADYAPTDTVLISGSDFTPNETYTLIISSADEPPVNFEDQVTADENGAFVYAYQLDGTYRPNYKVEARNQSGVIVATVTFTDTDVNVCPDGEDWEKIDDEGPQDYSAPTGYTVVEVCIKGGGDNSPNVYLEYFTSDGWYQAGGENCVGASGIGTANASSLYGEASGEVCAEISHSSFKIATSITQPYCGNGIVESNEQCDWGNQNEQSYCSSICTWNNVCLTDVNMIFNGGFEAPIVGTSQKWSIYPSGTAYLGWNVEWSGGSSSYDSATRPDPANLELHRGVNDWNPQEGSQYAELDTDWDGPGGSLNNEPASVKIYQDIPTIAGYQYQVSFWFSPRPGTSEANNQLQYGWNSNIEDTASGIGGGNTSWTLYNYTFTANGSITRIHFTDVGTADSFGTFIDNVSVVCLGSDQPVYSCGDTIYGINNNAGFSWVDPSSGEIHEFSTAAFGSSASADHPTAERTYYLRRDGASDTLAYYDHAADTHITVGSFSVSSFFTKLAFSPAGALYGLTDDHRLYSIDYTVPSATNLGIVSGVGSGGDIVFDHSGNLYLIDTNGNFYQINLGATPPTASLIANTGISYVSGLAFASGQFYVATRGADGASSDVYNMDYVGNTTLLAEDQLLVNDLSSCPLPQEIECGNNIVEDGEECDGTNGVTAGVNFCTVNCKLVPIYDGQHSCPPGTSPVFEQEISVSSKEVNGINVNLTSGTGYLFEASGTYNYDKNNSNKIADAAYGTADNWVSIRNDIGIWGTNRGVTSLLGDFGTGEIGLIEWDNNEIYDTDDHIYTKFYQPTSSPVQFLISDWYSNWYDSDYNNQGAMNDNDGALTLKIYECQEHGRLQGTKYLDENANGVHNYNSSLIPYEDQLLNGWDIRLYNDDWDFVDETTTAELGNKGQYRFDVAPGTYNICEKVKDGFIQTGPILGAESINNNHQPTGNGIAVENNSPNKEEEGSVCWQANLQSGETDGWLKFGNVQYGSIIVHKYEDFNLDGNKKNFGEQPEPGLSGWTFILYDDEDNPVGGSQKTGPNGYTTFKNIKPGDYSVCEQIPEGWVSSDFEHGKAFLNDSGEVCKNVTVTSGETVKNFRFGNYALGKVFVNKYEDVNQDGQRNFGEQPEPGLSGWTFILYDDEDNPVGGSQKTGPNGWTTFEDIKPGKYTICEQLQNGWANSDLDYNNAYSGNNEGEICRDVTIESGGIVRNFRFGNYLNPVTIKAYKVICDSEAYLPDWGNHGSTINADTAQNYVNDSEGHCQLVDDWKFQYGGIGNFGSFQTETDEKGVPWQTFNVNSDAVINDLSGFGSEIEVREVFPNNEYIGFSNDAGSVGSSVSAEFYCTGDVYNYDNWEWINNPQYGQTYHCVAFNALNYGSIQGRKYNDVNGNHVFDQEEKTDANRLNGWTIRLFDEAWNEIGDMFTGDSNTPAGPVQKGQYRFVNVPAGNYYVCEDVKQNEGWSQAEPSSGVVRPIVGGVCHGINLLPGQELTGIQFGNFKNGLVQGRKYNDLNVNGTHEVGDEARLDNWIIRLYDDWKKPIEVITGHTGQEGQYLFDNLEQSHTYQVCEVIQNGWSQTGPFLGVSIGGATAIANESGETDEGPVCWEFTINQSGLQFTNLKFGNVQYGSIAGKKYIDYNSDGQYNNADGDTLYNGWTIKLDKHDGTNYVYLTEATTDSNGEYLFENLETGMYLIYEVTDSGYEVTDPNEFGHYNVVNLLPGENLTGFDFGNFEKGDLYVDKYEDTDGVLGRTEGQEYWIGDPTFTFRVYEATTGGWLLKDQKDTIGDGRATFENIFDKPGDYFVCEVKKDGWEDMRSLHNPANNQSSALDEYSVCDPITVPGSGYGRYAEFGNIRYGSVSGMKFEDVDGNGIKDGGDSGLENWTIQLKQGGVIVDSTTTDVDGLYSFSEVLTDDYEVCEVEQVGWTRTQPSDSECWPIIVEPGQETDGIDFGNFQNGQITACKYDDYNGDGDKDEGEPAIMGIAMSLEKMSEVWVESKTGETGEDGCYLFEDLGPGEYRVKEDLVDSDLAGYFPTDSHTTDGDYRVSGAMTMTSNNSFSVDYFNDLNPISLSLDKTHNKVGSTVSRGETLNFALTVKNTAESTAYGVIVRDVLPSGFSYVEDTAKIGMIFSEPVISDQQLTWNVGNMAADQEIIITYDVLVSGSQAEGGYPNVAVAYGANRSSDPDMTTSYSNFAFVYTAVGIGISYSVSFPAVGGVVAGASIGPGGSVLGAATGSPTYLLIMAIMMILAGLAILFKKGRKYHV
jgi:uncharacterized repeat protein (TIGR01451 family)